MIRRTFDDKGISYASELILSNVQDLYKILEWNLAHDIYFYRLSSNMFPWASEYNMQDLPDYDLILAACQRAGDFARQHNMRLTSHPGPFNKLASPKERVFQLTKTDLTVHADMFDMIGLPRTPYAKLNIHVGAAYGDKPMALGNFNRNFERLSDAVKTRLTVENDDKKSLYSTKELYEEVYQKIGTPIVFDYHHHKFCDGDLREQDALALALSTWGQTKPVVHYSQSRCEEHNDNKIRENAHSDSYWTPFNPHGFIFDCMLEAKHKEQALFKMRQLLT
jgi:UV DNA damage endonuclease